MRQIKLLFTWKPESFDTALDQPSLVDLRAELSESRPLSGSLLVWKKNSEGNDWWLTDLEYKKVYHLKRK